MANTKQSGGSPNFDYAISKLQRRGARNDQLLGRVLDNNSPSRVSARGRLRGNQGKPGRQRRLAPYAY